MVPLVAPPVFASVKRAGKDEPPMATAPKSCVPGVSSSDAGLSVNVAVTVFAASIGTTQVAARPQAETDHDVKSLSGSAVAVRVTVSAKLAAHVAAQSMPDGEETTRPEPVPALT